MKDATDIPEALAKALDKAVESKIESAKKAAYISIGVALVSLVGALVVGILTYLGNVETTLIQSNTEERLQNLNARLQRSGQAITRAETVAKHYERLLDREEGTNKRLAFLNLWLLYTEAEDRRLLILTALQYAGDDVFELMLVLASELEGHEELITDLTQRKACLEDVTGDNHDCNVNEFAKQLLSKLNPEKAVEILLEAMARETLTSPNNANLDILRLLIMRQPELQSKLSELYQTRYTQLVGLSYLLYEYGEPAPFRQVLKADLAPEKKRELVEFLSGWPLLALEQADRAALIEFLTPLLKEFDNRQDQLFLVSVITTLKKLQGTMKDNQIQVIARRLGGFVANANLNWPIRSKAAEVLAAIDVAGLLTALKNVEVTDQFLLAEDFAGALASKTSILKENYSDRPPPTSQEFVQWQFWIKEVLHE